MVSLDLNAKVNLSNTKELEEDQSNTAYTNIINLAESFNVGYCKTEKIPPEMQKTSSPELNVQCALAPKISTETYLCFISLLYPQTYSLKALNDKFIEITTADKVKVRVAENNFHSYLYITKGDKNDLKEEEVECWVCDGDILVGEEIEAHKYTLRHIEKIMKDIDSCDCIRMLEPDRLYCIICFVEICFFDDYALTSTEHIKSEHHQNNLKNAKDDANLSKSNLINVNTMGKIVTLDAFVYFTNAMFPVSYTLKAENNTHIEIEMVNGDKVKLTEKSFHGLRDLEDAVECWTCDSLLFTNNEVFKHKYSLSHITRLMMNMTDKHCLKEIGKDIYSCILCLEDFKRVHKVEHIKTKKHKYFLKEVLFETHNTDSSEDEILEANVKGNPLTRGHGDNSSKTNRYSDKHDVKENKYKHNKNRNNPKKWYYHCSDTDNPEEVFCKVCNIKIHKSLISAHVTKTSHCTQYKILENNQLTILSNSKMHCKACNYYFQRNLFLEHIDLVGHRRRLKKNIENSTPSNTRNDNKENVNRHSLNIALVAKKGKPSINLQEGMNRKKNTTTSENPLQPANKALSLNQSDYERNGF